MTPLKTLFTDHPASADESYGEHLGTALWFAWKLFGAALAALVHAFLPFLFVKTGSRVITELYDRMVTNRHRHAMDHGTGPTDRTTVPA